MVASFQMRIRSNFFWVLEVKDDGDAISISKMHDSESFKCQ